MTVLTDLLGVLVSLDEANSLADAEGLLEAATHPRDLAMLAYEKRAEALAGAADQAVAGIWRSPALLAAIDDTRNDPLLLNMDRARYIAAKGGACDLDNEYHPLLSAGRSASLDDITTALDFLDKARDKDDAELWFAALQAEGSAYLHQARGDAYLAQSLAASEALEARLLGLLDPRDPFAEVNFLAHAAIMALYLERRFAWRIEAAYRRFLAAFPDDPFAGWERRADASAEYQELTQLARDTLVIDAREALLLRNPSDRSEIARLEQLLPPPAFVPAFLMPEPDAVKLPDLPAAAFQAAARALDRIHGALGPWPTRRPVAVLRAWGAFAWRGLHDFRQVVELLPAAGVDDEALGIVVQALRGEARYRMGRYEDAYLDLVRAAKAARAALGRRTPGAEKDASSWRRAERDGVARLTQKAGNALAAIGDEERARQAYAEVATLAVDPLSQATDLLNQGNLQFLHNSVVGGQGYITLDASARQAFVLHGPEKLIETVVGRHVSSLCEAERCYRAALDALSQVRPDAPGQRALLATCHINLGNVAWAWGQTLGIEDASRLDVLPLGDAFSSELVSGGSDARACFEAAIVGYGAGLASLGAEDDAGDTQLRADLAPLAATALSSSSEMRYLVAREQLRAAPPAQPGTPRDISLRKGIAEGRRCFALLRDDAASLYPDLAWRTHYNLARTYRLLGKGSKARTSFRRAIRVVEQLRANLRLEAFQVAFLHDKHDVYEGYIDFLLAEGEAEGDALRYLPEIFAIFERSRARAFLTLLQAANVKTGLPDDLRQEAEDLLARVSACNEAIQAAIAADDEDEAQKRLAEQKLLADAWANMQSRIAEAQQSERRTAPRIPQLGRFQAALGEDQAYLGVLLGDEASFALLIDRKAARAFRLPARRRLELLALPVLTYLTWSNAETAPQFLAANEKLTEALLGPLDAAVGLKRYLSGEDGAPPKHLLISPDGILCYLPFDALLADRIGLQGLPETYDYPDLRPFYLLSLADLSYIPSAAAWMEIGRRRRRASRHGLAAVYNVHYDTTDPPLWCIAENIMLKLGAVTSPPDMARITAAVKASWPDLDSVFLRSRKDDGAPEDESRQSTETNFRSVVPAARGHILMFHGHAIYNDRYPSLSGLIFNLSTAEVDADRAAIPTKEDGFLRVEELFQLDLPGVDLTLLAACQTALGAYRRGEGLSALVRGFLYRGSPAVMATLWEVRADMTAFLLKVFFRLLCEQPKADRARLFSQAKRKSIPYVANLCLPYFWAPFVLWGHTGPRGTAS